MSSLLWEYMSQELGFYERAATGFAFPVRLRFSGFTALLPSSWGFCLTLAWTFLIFFFSRFRMKMKRLLGKADPWFTTFSRSHVGQGWGTRVLKTVFLLC